MTRQEPMRQGGGGERRPRGGRHHGGRNGGHGGGGGGGHGGGNGGGNSGANMGGRPRSAASLRNQSFDSNGPDVRVRGNAWQVFEKYQSLARDANSAGDRVAAESYLQHAEHYYRIIEAINEATAAEQAQGGGGQNGGPGGGSGGGQHVGESGERNRGGSSSQPLNQQPEIPTHYYGSEPAVPAPAGNPAAPQSDEGYGAQEQASVEPRNPPPSPFFTQDEVEEVYGRDDSDPPLVAQR